MPPKKNSDAGAAAGGLDLTDSEIKLMFAMMEIMNRPSIDYDALAVKLGSASANAARTRVATAVKQHPTWFTGPGGPSATGEGSSTAGNDGSTPVKKPRVKRTPKKKAPSDEEDGENAEEQDTPSKKKARIAKVKEELADTTSEDIKPKLENPVTMDGQI
ncbi:hypothetical protein BDP55DRAFT_627748 [Colletotrichum godetiae]|uniref:Uncharacterized protein n=1 Tax=Colletotrichum godetiae TaxID=1209918 RepID=A0AAJ0AVH1_9PEZI|nr:uncharacterized protein BDP55DRAFT_627748 [Colletotrichum godetiae]KAK1691080.1 hypothetical protein BDP55DRAFT_627748 [Colletotrichum godetiae]